ncbi:MAG: hypothetical protein EU548_07155 [Promethearchaeota archaeon]|nr:MAG: hypothetical protein EU548_07155 [Candidatus Lokiarchaeota archaeon]
MTLANDHPWSKKEILANFVSILILMIYATIILLLKSWFSLLLYWAFWGLYFTVGRYVTCRHCDFLGRACCSWCVGIIGDKLYKRSNAKSFPEVGLWKMLLFDVSFLLLANIHPIIIYGISFLLNGIILIDLILLSIYALLGIITLSIHDQGCKKCPIKGCPLSRSKKKINDL